MSGDWGESISMGTDVRLKRFENVDEFDESHGPLTVLLVDDNEQWAQHIATELESQDPEMSVTLARSANEAMLTLQEDAEIDCLLTDYQMPNVDGLQLLERVREESPELPFILVTAKGDESVAAEAIDAGVSDYVVKDPRTDQVPLFANKIRTAVGRARLKQAIVESEARYRTLIEQSQDGIAIFTDQELSFWNPKLRELTGYGDETLAELDFIDDVIHEVDRQDMREALATLGESGQETVYETRIQAADGQIRHWEYNGRAITHGGEPAVMVSIRDVTARKHRERELAWVRELNEEVHRVLLESRTRDQLEATIAEELCRQGYDLAWFGDVSDDTLTTRVARGTTGYLAELDLSGGDSDTETEPSLWAMEAGEPKFIQEFSSLFPTAWQEAALECGFESGAALPLIHNDVLYGVLAVYDEEPNRFDQTEQDLLTELGETLAFAIHNLSTELALTTDRQVDVMAQLRDSEYYLQALAESAAIDGEAGSITVHGTVPHGDGAYLQYVTLENIDIDAFHDEAVADPVVVDVSHINEDDRRLQIHVDGETAEALLAERGIVVQSTEVTPNEVTLRFSLPGKDDIRRAVDTLESAFGATTVQSVVEGEADDGISGTGVDLTEKQAAALEAAYFHGYFEKPRQSSASEVADALGVTHPTFLHHLRTAQQKIFASRFD